jgi:hypothetical protein
MLNKAKLEFLQIQQQIASFATLYVSTDGRNKETSSLILPPARSRLCGVSQENVMAVTSREGIDRPILGIPSGSYGGVHAPYTSGESTPRLVVCLHGPAATKGLSGVF